MESIAALTTPQTLVEGVLKLISLPEAYLRLQQTIDQPTHTREQIAEVIAYDPGLSARVLRIANSSYYGFAGPLENIFDAVGVIGESDLRNLVLAASVVNSMSSLPNQGVDINQFWLHSLRCGIGARIIAKAIRHANRETLFLAGMLHDLGVLVIYQTNRSLANEVNQQIEQHHQLRDQAERELLGFDHAEVGGLLAEAWGLPTELCELVRCHHQIQLAGDLQQSATILALANQLADDNNPPVADVTEVEQNPQIAKLAELLELDAAKIPEIVVDVEFQCEEISNIFFG